MGLIKEAADPIEHDVRIAFPDLGSLAYLKVEDGTVVDGNEESIKLAQALEENMAELQSELADIEMTMWLDQEQD